jgi:hypothetical protein
VGIDDLKEPCRVLSAGARVGKCYLRSAELGVIARVTVIWRDQFAACARRTASPVFAEDAPRSVLTRDRNGGFDKGQAE